MDDLEFLVTFSIAINGCFTNPEERYIYAPSMEDAEKQATELAEILQAEMDCERKGYDYYVDVEDITQLTQDDDDTTEAPDALPF